MARPFLSLAFQTSLTIISRATYSYRVSHQVSELGLVDFDLDVQLILPRCSASSANLPSAQAESGNQWSSQNQSQPNLGPRSDGSPCTMKTVRIRVCLPIDVRIVKQKSSIA